MKNSKFDNKLKMCIEIIYTNIDIHREIWEKEIKENDGFLKPSLKSNLTKSLNTVKKLHKKDYIVTQNELSKLIIECYNFIPVRNSRATGAKNYDFKVESKTLPEKFLDSFVSWMLTMEFMTEKLEITINRQDDEFKKEFNKLKKLTQTYSDFIEKEIIIGG